MTWHGKWHEMTRKWHGLTRKLTRKVTRKRNTGHFPVLHSVSCYDTKIFPCYVSCHVMTREFSRVTLRVMLWHENFPVSFSVSCYFVSNRVTFRVMLCITRCYWPSLLMLKSLLIMSHSLLLLWISRRHNKWTQPYINIKIHTQTFVA